MNISFEALDTLFFRDGKPFSLGDENWADGLFPPPPSVIYGALRTWIATQQGIPFEEVETKLNDVQVSNLSFYIEDRNSRAAYYLPLPADLAESKDKDEKTLRKEKNGFYGGIIQLLPHVNSVVSSLQSYNNLDYIFLPPKDTYVESVPDGLIEVEALKMYLQSGRLPRFFRRIKDFVRNEPKTGNGRDATVRSVKEGSLFRVGMRRPCGLSFVVQTKGLADFTPAGTSLVKFGAEGKLANISSVEYYPELPKFQVKGSYFKLYLATPAIFTTNHWYPDLKKFGISAQLVGACMGKPQHIGGFSMNDGSGKPKPKPMYKTVPAGSVFFFRSEDDPAKINAMQGMSVSDEREKEGFGICYIGNFNPEQSA